MPPARNVNVVYLNNPLHDPPGKHNYPSGTYVKQYLHGGPNHYPSMEQTIQTHKQQPIVKKEKHKGCGKEKEFPILLILCKVNNLRLVLRMVS